MIARSGGRKTESQITQRYLLASFYIFQNRLLSPSSLPIALKVSIHRRFDSAMVAAANGDVLAFVEATKGQSAVPTETVGLSKDMIGFKTEAEMTDKLGQGW